MICYMETNELKYSLYSPNSVSRVHNSDKKNESIKNVKTIISQCGSFYCQINKDCKKVWTNKNNSSATLKRQLVQGGVVLWGAYRIDIFFIYIQNNIQA